MTMPWAARTTSSWWVRGRAKKALAAELKVFAQRTTGRRTLVTRMCTDLRPCRYRVCKSLKQWNKMKVSVVLRLLHLQGGRAIWWLENISYGNRKGKNMHF